MAHSHFRYAHSHPGCRSRPKGSSNACARHPTHPHRRNPLPEDTYTDTQRRARDYQQMGAETIWIIDPETRTGRVCTGDSWTQATRLEVPNTLIHVELETLFADLG